MTWKPGEPVDDDLLNPAILTGNWDALHRTFPGNLLADPATVLWSAGETAAPDHWQVGGAGVAILRYGPGIGARYSDMSARLTAAAAAATLAQNLLPPAVFQPAFRGVVFSAGAWVFSQSPSAGRIYFYDGTGSATRSIDHAGDSTFQWLTVTHTVGAPATRLEFGYETAAGTNLWAGGATVVIGAVPPATWFPAPVVRRTVVIPVTGTLATGTALVGIRLTFDRPSLVLETRLRVGTPPASQALIVDINRDGTSIYTTRPQIAAAATSGAARPDGSYPARCFSRSHVLTADLDQVGTGTPGADLMVFVDVLQWARPFEVFLGPGDVN